MAVPEAAPDPAVTVAVHKASRPTLVLTQVYPTELARITTSP
jgi:hypothetical protein